MEMRENLIANVEFLIHFQCLDAHEEFRSSRAKHLDELIYKPENI
jgi:hypothetical protein